MTNPAATPLPEEPRKCPTCGTKLIPAAQAFSEIRERITAEEPQDFAEEMRERAGADAHARNHAAEEPPAEKYGLETWWKDVRGPHPDELTASPQEAVRELEDAWAEYADWRADSAADGIARSFSLCRLEDARTALSSQLERLKAEQLTAEEALQILRAFSDAGVLSEAGNETRNPLFETFWVAVDKLRRLSQQGDTQE